MSPFRNRNLLKVFLQSYFIYSQTCGISLPQLIILKSENWGSWYLCTASDRGGGSVLCCAHHRAARLSQLCSVGSAFVSSALGGTQTSGTDELSVSCCSDLSREFTLTGCQNLQSCTRTRTARGFMPAPSSDLLRSNFKQYRQLVFSRELE